MPDDFQAFPALRGARLDALCGSARSRGLDQLDAYYAARQYESRRYNWDGQLIAYADADIGPGWYIPLRRRRPSTRYDLPRLIVRRLTAMMLGEENWPEINVEGDDNAEDYVKTLASESGLPAKFSELRNKGGACGTAVASFAFIDGKPRVSVHNARHVHVIRWADRDECRPAEVLEAYAYVRAGYTTDGRPVEKTYYFARYWSQQTEVIWDPIPDALARNGTWAASVGSRSVEHGYGDCPVYWCQNLPDSDQPDGVSDFDGLQDNFDSINTVLSATTRGTVANVDPTLVIKDDPTNNPGRVLKGGDNAIFSKNGADFLELRGDSLKTALELVKALSKYCLDVAGVVIGDPEKMGAKAQSAAAMRVLYQPMINQCDMLRAQYGKFLVQLLGGMLRAAKQIHGTAPGEVVVTEDGRRIQHKPTVVLPPRVDSVETSEGVSKDGKRGRLREKRVRAREPGSSEYIQLRWPTYFKANMTDIAEATKAAGLARGVTISDRTAVKFTAPLYGVEDVDKELADLDADNEARAMQISDNMPGADEDGGDGGEE